MTSRDGHSLLKANTVGRGHPPPCFPGGVRKSLSRQCRPRVCVCLGPTTSAKQVKQGHSAAASWSQSVSFGPALFSTAVNSVGGRDF